MGTGLLFKQGPFHMLIAAVSFHLDSTVQDQTLLWLTGSGQICQETASKDQALGLICNLNESRSLEAQHPINS